MRLNLVAGCALLVLAGCGAEDEPPSIDEVADSLGCSDFELGDGQAMTREVGSCTVNGEDVYVHTFTDQNQMDMWLEVAPAGGGVFVEGDLWAAQTFSADVAETLAETADGQVR